MPKQKRWTIKRQIDQATNHIDSAIDDVVLAGHEFEDIHSEYYEAFSRIAHALQASKKALITISGEI